MTYQSGTYFNIEFWIHPHDKYFDPATPNLTGNNSTLGNKSFRHETISKNHPEKQYINTGKDPWSINALEKAGVYDEAPYNLLCPDFTYTLPGILKEVSGISLDKQGNMYCVQDELGVVFGYDLEQGRINQQYRFSYAGDFEDLAIKGDSIFALRSDGNIFGFKFPKKAAVKQRKISLGASDYESLTYDEETKLFYIVSKDNGDDTGKMKRTIYSFQHNHSTTPQAIISIDITILNMMLKQQYPELIFKKFDFNPSAIAIHPKTQDFYVLSANDRILVVCSSTGVKRLYPLPTELYYKPEGMTFASDGTLYISTEGEKQGSVGGMIYKFSTR